MRQCPPTLASGLTLFTNSACDTSRSSQSIGCASVHARFPFDQSKSTTPQSAEMLGSVKPLSLHGMKMVLRDMLYVGSHRGTYETARASPLSVTNAAIVSG